MTINNNNIFGAFTLNEARGSRLTGDWLNKESVANYGWFGGGAIPANTATVDRIDFSNDSIVATARGLLSLSRNTFAATGNSNYGWFGGGTSPGPVLTSTVDRIDFSNDATTASPRGPLSLERSGVAATGNSNYGWFGGGSFPSSSQVANVDRIDFSNDSSTTSVRGPLSSARGGLAATGNSNYGWFSSATAPGIILDRIDFSNDSGTASPRGPLSSIKFSLGATGNSNYGWFGGGQNPGPSVNYSSVDRIDFSNDLAAASVRGPLSSARNALAATGNSNYGWFSGGGIPALVSTVDRIDFSNDSSTISVRGSLTGTGKQFHAATSGVLNIRRQKAGNYGWFGGGDAPASTPSNLSTVDRIDFSNDSVTASLRTAKLNAPAGRTKLAATGNSNYGWFGGGWIPSTTFYSIVDRIDFSNDSSIRTRGSLSQGRYGLAATGNSNYGWFGGGSNDFPTPANNVDTVDRIDFSNDSATALPRGPLSAARYSLAATGNSNYGWFAGGATGLPQVTTIDRIDFANDSTLASVRGPLTTPAFAKQNHAATGNSNYGWFAGGSTGIYTSSVYRINFSNDSVLASPRSPLSPGGRNQIAATGNSNYGWFAGGIPGPVDKVDRIDFSNDSVQASVRGSLSSARSELAATSNTSR